MINDCSSDAISSGRVSDETDKFKSASVSVALSRVVSVSVELSEFGCDSVVT